MTESFLLEGTIPLHLGFAHIRLPAGECDDCMMPGWVRRHIVGSTHLPAELFWGEVGRNTYTAG